MDMDMDMDMDMSSSGCVGARYVFYQECYLLYTYSRGFGAPACRVFSDHPDYLLTYLLKC